MQFFPPISRPHSAADSKLAGLPIKDKALVKSRGRGCTTALPSACLHKLGDTGRSTSQRGTNPTIQQDGLAPNTALSLCPDPLVGLLELCSFPQSPSFQHSGTRGQVTSESSPSTAILWHLYCLHWPMAGSWTPLRTCASFSHSKQLKILTTWSRMIFCSLLRPFRNKTPHVLSLKAVQGILSNSVLLTNKLFVNSNKPELHKDN